MPQLKDDLTKGIHDLMMEDERPTTLGWSVLLDRLAKKRDSEGVKTISLDELKDMATKDNLVASEEEIPDFLSFMKEMGMLYYFDTPEELSQTIILDPQWMVDGVKAS